MDLLLSTIAALGCGFVAGAFAGFAYACRLWERAIERQAKKPEGRGLRGMY